jgi:Flp pilus assembly protein TadD
MNLGRLYAARGEVSKAIAEFEGALKESPGESACRAALVRLRQRIN